MLKKTKRILDEEKVEQSIRDRDVSGFIQTITESMKQLQKTDPSFKKLMKNILEDEADSQGAASSKTEAGKKLQKSLPDSMEKIPDRFEEEADSEDKARALERPQGAYMSPAACAAATKCNSDLHVPIMPHCSRQMQWLRLACRVSAGS